MTKTLLFALTLIAAPAFAQPSATPAAASKVDARFAAWLGCWRLEDDLAGTGARLCVTPEGTGVRMQTIFDKNKGIDEVVIADGVAHPIQDAECKGTERAEFSQDSMRVFRETNVTCGKDAPRVVKSIVFTSGSDLINVQHLSGANALAAVRVERYRRAANQQLADGSKAPQASPDALIKTATMDARWSIEDVIEASGKVPAEAVQAALTELKYGFDLNKKTLLALNAGGVKGEVIDLMVALTYPKRFVIERRGGGGAMPAGISTGMDWLDPMMSPMMMGAMADCFNPYGYGYRSYYSMCGAYYRYGYSAMYDPIYRNGYYGYGYNNYGWVDIGQFANVGGNGGGTSEPAAEGRVVHGQGFTQIRTRDAEPAPRVNSGGNGGAWAGSSGGGVSSGGGFSSGSSSSGSSGGSSSGGSDSGARVAVPKGGGGL